MRRADFLAHTLGVFHRLRPQARSLVIGLPPKMEKFLRERVPGNCVLLTSARTRRGCSSPTATAAAGCGGPPGAGVHPDPARNARGRTDRPDKIAEVVAVVAASCGWREISARPRSTRSPPRRSAGPPTAMSWCRRSARRAGSGSWCCRASRRRGWRSSARPARSGTCPTGSSGVVDVGGGSSELVVGHRSRHGPWCDLVRARIRRPGRRLPAVGPAVRAAS